jgi:hypothetical protein
MSPPSAASWLAVSSELLVAVACSVLVASGLGFCVAVVRPDVVAVALLVLSSPPHAASARSATERESQGQGYPFGRPKCHRTS